MASSCRFGGVRRTVSTTVLSSAAARASDADAFEDDKFIYSVRAVNGSVYNCHATFISNILKQGVPVWEIVLGMVEIAFENIYEHLILASGGKHSEEERAALESGIERKMQEYQINLFMNKMPDKAWSSDYFKKDNLKMRPVDEMK